MATSAVAVAGFGSTGNARCWDIIATADADTTLAITHGITMADAVNDPDQRTRVVIEPRGAKAYADGATQQNWFVASITSTTLTLTKGGTGAGSGDAASQARVHLEYYGGPAT